MEDLIVNTCKKTLYKIQILAFWPMNVSPQKLSYFPPCCPLPAVQLQKSPGKNKTPSLKKNLYFLSMSACWLTYIPTHKATGSSCFSTFTVMSEEVAQEKRYFISTLRPPDLFHVLAMQRNSFKCKPDVWVKVESSKNICLGSFVHKVFLFGIKLCKENKWGRHRFESRHNDLCRMSYPFL